MENLEGTRKEVHYHHYGSCCRPYGSRAGLFCGGVLLLVGTVWLLTSLNVLPDSLWKLIGPAILVVWGAGILFFRDGASTEGRPEPR